jgi:hypothetical protein
MPFSRTSVQTDLRERREGLAVPGRLGDQLQEPHAFGAVELERLGPFHVVEHVGADEGEVLPV